MNEQEQIIDILIEIINEVSKDGIQFEVVLRVQPYLKRLKALNFSVKRFMRG